MNDPGVDKIYCIKKSSTSFPVFFTPGETIDISVYLSDSLTELEFDPTTFRQNGSTERTAAGLIKKKTVSFKVNELNPTNDALLSTLENEPHVFVFGDIEGYYYLFGTNNYWPRFSFSEVHENPPSSKKYYLVTITLAAPFGLIFCTIP